MANKMKINEKLRRLRIEAGLSQEAFGAICYSSQGYVKQYEKGWIKPDDYVIEFIADYFFIDPDVLADESNDIYLPEFGLLKKRAQTKPQKNTDPKIALVSNRCSTCMYKSSTFGKTDGCIYILATGHRRGCPAGDECDKYEKGEEVKRWKAIDLVSGGFDF